MVILALGAHFDDVEVGIGGILIQHVEAGDQVYIAISNADEYRTGDPTLRMKEQFESAKVLGIDDGNVFMFRSSQQMPDVINKLDAICANVVYVPFWKDTHQDHVRCSRIGQAVGRKRNVDVFFYDSGSTYEFSPTVFVKIDFNKKQKLLNCFLSQIESGMIAISKYKHRDAYIASLISDDYDSHAEGLVVRRMQYKINK